MVHLQLSPGGNFEMQIPSDPTEGWERSLRVHHRRLWRTKSRPLGVYIPEPD